MRAIAGYTLFAIGLGFAISHLGWLPGQGSRSLSERGNDTLNKPRARGFSPPEIVVVELVAVPRTFSPVSPYFAETAAQGVSVLAQAPDTDTRDVSVGAEAWVTTVRVEPLSSSEAWDIAKPIAASEGKALVMRIQTEMTRAGCYTGAIDGAWDADTQMAMADFTKKVRSKLSSEAPDPVMVMLLQANSGTVCGTPCAKGLVADTNGSCAPALLVADRTPPKTSLPKVELPKKSLPKPEVETSSVWTLTPQNKLDEQMSLSGPLPNPDAPPSAEGQTSPDPQTVSLEPREKPKPSITVERRRSRSSPPRRRKDLGQYRRRGYVPPPSYMGQLR